MEGEKSECPDFVLTRKETAGRLRISLRTLTRIERDKKLAPPKARNHCTAQCTRDGAADAEAQASSNAVI
jgi:hypothetical protein